LLHQYTEEQKKIRYVFQILGSGSAIILVTRRRMSDQYSDN
jgi:hypothetical protein